MTTRRLNLESSEEELSTVFGINSQLQLYRLAFMINKATGLNVSLLKKPIKVNGESVSCYSVEVEDYELTLYLFSNKQGTKLLLPHLKNFDFLLFFPFHIPLKEWQELDGRIKQATGVVGVIALPEKEVKNLRIEL